MVELAGSLGRPRAAAQRRAVPGSRGPSARWQPRAGPRRSNSARAAGRPPRRRAPSIRGS
eukprot:9478668-Pyramimonas_sp.AAC.1